MSSQSDSNDSSKSGDNSLQKLFSKIQQAALAGDFREAEKLREELIATEPMAISEAIKSAEFIEKEMAANMDKEHQASWPELYDQLTVEERNCIFYSMKNFTLPANKILLKYDSLNNRLFFIEAGKVAVAVPQNDNKLKVIAQLGRGDVLGEYTFATLALCSATAVTKTEVRLRCLEGKIAEEWDDKHPGLYEKLIDYCLKFGKVDQIERRKEAQERAHPRFPVQGKVNATLLNKDGERTEVTFRGDIEEISLSGTSFGIHANRKETVKKLLTRSLFLDFTCNHGGNRVSFTIQGKVIRVSFLLYNDYLLHIGFDTLVPGEIISKLKS